MDEKIGHVIYVSSTNQLHTKNVRVGRKDKDNVEFIPTKVTGPLRKGLEEIRADDPLTPENIRKMENNVFVRLTKKFPELSRSARKARAREIIKEEVKRRKAKDATSKLDS